MHFIAFLTFFLRKTALISGNKRKKTTELNDLPEFLRFDRVELYYSFTGPAIVKKCQSLINRLQPVKRALNDSNLVTFNCRIKQNNENVFNDHYQLLGHIQNELLQIFDFSRGYKFYICFDSDMNAATNVVASVLKMAPILSSTNVEIVLHGLQEHPMEMPVKDISNWLHRNSTGFSKRTEKKLEFFSHVGIDSALELCAHLKKMFVFLLFIKNDLIFKIII